MGCVTASLLLRAHAHIGDEGGVQHDDRRQQRDHRHHPAVGHQHPAQNGQGEEDQPEPLRGAFRRRADEVHREKRQVVRVQKHQDLSQSAQRAGGREGGREEREHQTPKL